MRRLLAQADAGQQTTSARLADFQQLLRIAQTGAGPGAAPLTVEELHAFARSVPAFVPGGFAPAGAADLLDTLAGLRPEHREIYLMTAGQPPLDDIEEAAGRLTSGQRARISDIVQVPVLIGTDPADELSRSLWHALFLRIAHADRTGGPDRARELAGLLGILRRTGLPGGADNGP